MALLLNMFKTHNKINSALPWVGGASLAVQLVKNPPAMREAWVQSLGWEDALEKGTANHSRILAWRIPWGRKERLSDFHFHFLFMYICISSHIFYCCYKPLPLHWAFAVLWSFPFSSLPPPPAFCLSSWKKKCIIFFYIIPLFTFPTVLFPL